MEIFFSRRSILKFGAITASAFMTDQLFSKQQNVTFKRKENQKMQSNIFADAYKNGQYALPPLPYDYKALEPFYDEQTLKIHHDKHHEAYVKKLNAALTKLETARNNNDFSTIQGVSNELAFNGSGHILHTLFWHSMKPGGNNNKMPGELEEAFEESFGSAKAAQTQFTEATKAVEGSGWGILALEPVANKLVILQCEKHQNLTIWGVTPLLVCDVWEHAYYLKFQNNRPQWVENFMKIANWDFAAQRLSEARSLIETSR